MIRKNLSVWIETLRKGKERKKSKSTVKFKFYTELFLELLFIISMRKRKEKKDYSKWVRVERGYFSFFVVVAAVKSIN